MISIFIEDSFDSAHLLPNVPTDHKCQRMHGHTYRVRLEVAGEVDHRTGWIIDYAELKAARERGQRAGSAALHRKAVRAAAAEKPAEQPAEKKPKFQPTGTFHIKSASLNGGPCPKCGHKYSQSKGHTSDRRQRRKCKNGGCGFAFILPKTEQAA